MTGGAIVADPRVLALVTTRDVTLLGSDLQDVSDSVGYIVWHYVLIVCPIVAIVWHQR